MFSGMSSVSVSSRLPDPKPGVGDYLINEIKRKENQGGNGFRVALDLTCIRAIGGDVVVGEHVGYPIFGGKFFQKEIKRLLMVLAGITAETEAEWVEEMAPKDPKAKAVWDVQDELSHAEQVWDRFARAVIAVDAKGNPLPSGTFDGQAVVRFETVYKEPKETGTFTKDESGLPIPVMTKGFTNVYPIKLIPMLEVADFLDDKEIAQYFGSTEKFAELC